WFEGRTGLRGMLQHELVPLPFHISRNGVEAFVRFWSYPQRLVNFVRWLPEDRPWDSAPHIIRNIISAPFYAAIAVIVALPIFVAPVLVFGGLVAIFGTLFGIFEPLLLGMTLTAWAVVTVTGFLLMLFHRSLWFSTKYSKNSGDADGQMMMFWAWT